MPRVARSVVPGCPYHAMNRGNGRMTLFRKPADYDAFCRVLIEALGRYAVDLYAWCLMPNHWHLLLAERDAGQLSAFMSWVGVTHVRRHNELRRVGFRPTAPLAASSAQAWVGDPPYRSILAAVLPSSRVRRAWRALRSTIRCRIARCGEVP